jgi:hypothetical protein
MKASGWGALDPIDVVRMPNGSLVAVDNTRLAAAKLTRTPVQATLREFDEVLPIARDEFNKVFSNLKTGERASTWGEAVLNRIARQKRLWVERYPQGSPFTGVNQKSGRVNP